MQILIDGGLYVNRHLKDSVTRFFTLNLLLQTLYLSPLGTGYVQILLDIFSFSEDIWLESSNLAYLDSQQLSGHTK